MHENFGNWNDLKIKLHLGEKNLNVKEKEIWYISLGENIGFEQSGKGENFLRPVIVYKKFNNRLFYGIPLTSTKKESKFYYNFEFQQGVLSSAILSQMRLFDTKRLFRRCGMMSHQFYGELQEKIKKLLF